MEHDYKLCRREIAEGRLCNKTIAKKNAMNWCEEHRYRLPFWPVEGLIGPAVLPEETPR